MGINKIECIMTLFKIFRSTRDFWKVIKRIIHLHIDKSPWPILKYVSVRVVTSS